jgi:hypothetical protein
MKVIISLVGIAVGAIGITGFLSMEGCDVGSKPVSASGVTKAEVKVPKGSDGLTSEQRNIRDRLIEDNKPGALKHLYIISPYSGQVILYSTIRGKATSGGKRLDPTTVKVSRGANMTDYNGFAVEFGGSTQLTEEVLQDDGTYGSSGDYFYWWDQKGAYHQHYLTGGQIIHISNTPISVNQVIINIETQGGTPPAGEARK